MYLTDQPKFAPVIDGSPSEKRASKPAESKQRPIGRGSAKKQKAMDIIVDSVKISISQSQPFQTTTGDVSSDIAELKEGIKKANETMDSLLKYQPMTMAPSSIKNQYFNDVFANISQAEAEKKLKLDLERKKLEKELESVERESIGENVGRMFKTPDERQDLQHDGEDVQCCWKGACLFVGMTGPTLDECGHSDCISREKFHHHAWLTG